MEGLWGGGNDNAGIFLYTFLQFGMQSLAVAYVLYVMRLMRAPVLTRWGVLIFFGVYPIFPMWAYTMVKDSGYYILVLLLVTVLVHMLCGERTKPRWPQNVLLSASALGICFYRKDGLWVVALTLVCGIIAHRELRRLFLGVLALCMSTTFLINDVYRKMEEIPPSPVREALSVPLQQTARYVREHYGELTQEETEILQGVFDVDAAELAGLYDPELSDPVKARFALYPEEEELKAYFHVWWEQLLKHPDTYVQAFLNHMYGYVCPDKKDGWAGEDIGVFYIFAPETGLKLGYEIESDGGRKFLEGYSRTVRQLPVLGMLYSPGLHTWILIGCILFLAQRKKWRELTVYLPGCCILLVCMLSPVNTCTRYALPLMALLPLHLMWAWKKGASSGEE